MRECSRNRPTIETTRMRSLRSGTPGRSVQNAAHDEVHVYAIARRAVKRAYNVRIGKTVELRGDSRRTSGTSERRFAVDPLEDAVEQMRRRDQESARCSARRLG